MKKYLDIYNNYKELILSQQLKAGDKMPSVRSAAKLLEVSKTTIENAYFELQADGYIVSSPKSGYFVCEVNTEVGNNDEQIFNAQSIKYDLKSGDADRDSFDIAIWQRYIKSALRQTDRLLSYGDVQGESDLRAALSDYIREKRNVSASPDRIVVGAGVQSLLSILCSLTDERNTVSFPDSSFIKGINLFKNYGYTVHTRDKEASIIYVSPSHMTSFGNVMPIKRRLELIKQSEKNNSLIIEDDFDADFVYQSKPTPSIYALSGGKNVVYMGSFSNVLIPGIRISFMVLTKELANEFKLKKDLFAQTASKTEQIALCGYIRDGHINSQTRKIRRLYTEKTKDFLGELKKQLPLADCRIGENGLQIALSMPFDKDISVFERYSLSVIIKEIKDGMISIVLVPSAIPKNDINEAVSALKAALT